MEGRALIAETLLAGGESAEVVSSLGDGLAVETHDDTAEGLITVGDIEVDLVSDLGTLGSLSGRRKEDHADSNKEQGANSESAQVEHGGQLVWQCPSDVQLCEEKVVEIG